MPQIRERWSISGAAAAIIFNVPIFLRSVGWLACVVYSTIPSFWLVIHPRANFWRSRKRSPYRLLLPFWIATWIVAAAVTSPWSDRLLYRSTWTWLLAAVLFIAGLGIYRRAGAGFSAAQLGGLPELLPGHR